jgi:hypothetical protein
MRTRIEKLNDEGITGYNVNLTFTGGEAQEDYNAFEDFLLLNQSDIVPTGPAWSSGPEVGNTFFSTDHASKAEFLSDFRSLVTGFKCIR